MGGWNTERERERESHCVAAYGNEPPLHRVAASVAAP